MYATMSSMADDPLTYSDLTLYSIPNLAISRSLPFSSGVSCIIFVSNLELLLNEISSS